MNWHAEKSNASVISLRIWYQQHFSVLSEFIERCSLASSLLVGKTFHLYAGFLIGFRDVITGLRVIAVPCIENRENICMRVKWPEQTQNWRNYWICNIKKYYLAPLTMRSQGQIQPQHLHTRLCKASTQFPKHICDPHLRWRKHQAEKWGIYLSLCCKLEATFSWGMLHSSPQREDLGRLQVVWRSWCPKM